MACAGQSSSSTPNSPNHAIMDFAYVKEHGHAGTENDLPQTVATKFIAPNWLKCHLEHCCWKSVSLVEPSSLPSTFTSQ